MSILNPQWQKGRLLPGEHKGELLQEYLCYGCQHVCRESIPVRESPPEDCCHPDILQRNQEIKDDVNEIFGRKIY